MEVVHETVSVNQSIKVVLIQPAILREDEPIFPATFFRILTDRSRHALHESPMGPWQFSRYLPRIYKRACSDVSPTENHAQLNGLVKRSSNSSGHARVSVGNRGLSTVCKLDRYGQHCKLRAICQNRHTVYEFFPIKYCNTQSSAIFATDRPICICLCMLDFLPLYRKQMFQL
jgi:hypothetical protein